MSKKAAYDPAAWTVEVEGTGVPSSVVKSATVPDTVEFVTEKKKASRKTAVAEDPLLKAMESASLKPPPPPPPRKSGLETSMLASIAEGDDDDVITYTSLVRSAVDGKGAPCKPKLTPDLMTTVGLKARSSISAAVELMALAQMVCLTFVCDTTGSMAPHMQGIKDQIRAIVDGVRSTGCTITALGFVGYKDWCDGPNHIEVFPITKADTDGLARFRTFVNGLTPTGGGDYPEDVLGGLDAAVRLSWPTNCGTRVIFHIGDAPPHGNPTYHDSSSDDYPRGHSRDRPLAELFADFKSKAVNLYFGRINDGCDKMIKVFEGAYGAPIEAFDTSDPSAITASVTDSVSRSVSASCSASVSMTKTKGLRRDFTLCPTVPSWDTLPVHNGSLVSLELPESVEVIMNFDALKQVIKSCRVKIAPHPFAHGSVRLAYYGQVLFGAGHGSATADRVPVVDDYIFKEMRTLATIPELDRMRYLVDLEVQTVAATIAFKFNERLGLIRGAPDWKLKFLMAKVLRVTNADGSLRFMAAEKMYRGPRPEMVRFTNNLNYVADESRLDEQGQKCLPLALAFAHFSYDYTEGYLLVCDLQGLPSVSTKGKSTLLLTDPAIHCPKHTRFGKTNLQLAGVQAFFKQHKCNALCHGLGLKVPSF